MASSGHTYEREAIFRWLAWPGGKRDPITKAPLRARHVVPNLALRSAICEWLEAQQAPPSRAPSPRASLAHLAPIQLQPLPNTAPAAQAGSDAPQHPHVVWLPVMSAHTPPRSASERALGGTHAAAWPGAAYSAAVLRAPSETGPAPVIATASLTAAAAPWARGAHASACKGLRCQHAGSTGAADPIPLVRGGSAPAASDYRHAQSNPAGTDALLEQSAPVGRGATGSAPSDQAQGVSSAVQRPGAAASGTLRSRGGARARVASDGCIARRTALDGSDQRCAAPGVPSAGHGPVRCQHDISRAFEGLQQQLERGSAAVGRLEVPVSNGDEFNSQHRLVHEIEFGAQQQAGFCRAFAEEPAAAQHPAAATALSPWPTHDEQPRGAVAQVPVQLLPMVLPIWRPNGAPNSAGPT